MSSYSRPLDPAAQIPNFTGFLSKGAGGVAILVADENNSTAGEVFGAIPGGTVLGKITAGGAYRPCAKQIVDDAQTDVNEIEMQSVKHFKLGDTVAIYDVSAGGILSGASNRNITAIDDTSDPPTLTIDGAPVTVAVGDYVYANDGSGTAAGIIDEQGASTFAGLDINGLPRYEQAGAVLVFEGVVDEDKLDALNDLNTHIKADLINPLIGCNITFR